MEDMGQGKRPYGAINFKYEELEEIVKLSKQLEKQTGLKYSNRSVILYALNKLKKELKKT